MINTGKRYHWTEKDKQEIRRLYEVEEYSHYDIAVHLGCNHQTICYHLRKMGVKARGRGMQTARARAKYMGVKHHGWKGGRSLTHYGYVQILKRDHPQADRDGYVLEHRYILEQHLLKTNPNHPALKNGVLRKNWVAHHKNGKKDDNRQQNLEAMPRKKHHSFLHYKEEILCLRRLLKENGISY